jgi:hypothetical protein
MFLGDLQTTVVRVPCNVLNLNQQIRKQKLSISM